MNNGQPNSARAFPRSCRSATWLISKLYLTERAQGGWGMDDRRFDSLVKSLAGGASRRAVLKGLLGLGGAAAVGGTLLEGPAEAARRPTPTPTPLRCPGNQTRSAGSAPVRRVVAMQSRHAGRRVAIAALTRRSPGTANAATMPVAMAPVMAKSCAAGPIAGRVACRRRIGSATRPVGRSAARIRMPAVSSMVAARRSAPAEPAASTPAARLMISAQAAPRARISAVPATPPVAVEAPMRMPASI